MIFVTLAVKQIRILSRAPGWGGWGRAWAWGQTGLEARPGSAPYQLGDFKRFKQVM